LGDQSVASVNFGWRRIEAENDKQESVIDSSPPRSRNQGSLAGIGWLITALVIAGLLTAEALSVFTKIELVVLLAIACYWLAFLAVLIAILNKFAPAPSGEDRFGPTSWTAVALVAGVLLIIGVVLTSLRY
jgi:hypothetical protein